jgi:hypothetical protein
MYVVARYHEFIDDTASDCTSAGDAIARATSGLFGLETARSWEHAALIMSAAAPNADPSFIRVAIIL